MERRDPAPRSSRAEHVAADLEHEILTARLPVGAHLQRRSELMDRFGISPRAMNETLRILGDRDLVTVRSGPGGGSPWPARPGGPAGCIGSVVSAVESAPSGTCSRPGCTWNSA